MQEVQNNYNQAETTIQSRGKQTKLRRLATAPYSLVERLVKKFKSLQMLAATKEKGLICLGLAQRHTATERTNLVQTYVKTKITFPTRRETVFRVRVSLM